MYCWGVRNLQSTFEFNILFNICNRYWNTFKFCQDETCKNYALNAYKINYYFYLLTCNISRYENFLKIYEYIFKNKI